MWYNARVAVAPHGAGNSNMVVARRPFALVEFQERLLIRCFEDTALALGFECVTRMCICTCIRACTARAGLRARIGRARRLMHSSVGRTFPYWTRRRARRYNMFLPPDATHDGPMTVDVPAAVDAVAAALARQGE